MLCLECVLAVDHQPSCRLDDEGGNIENNKHKGDAACSNAEDSVIGEVEVYHSAESHVDESIDPERCQYDKELLGCVDARG